MFGVLESVQVSQAGLYPTYDALWAELSGKAIKDGYKIVKSRSHRSRQGGGDVPNNEMVRCDLVCDRGGRPYKCMATKHKSSTKKTGCPWKAKAVHRKTAGGWILTIICDQHNHAPGTPEPPTPSEVSENEDEDVELEDSGPQPDAETSAALQVAGVSNEVLRLTGDTFSQFKVDYRKMSQPERFGILSQLQLRIAAIYAVQNEDMQRQRRADAQQKRHQEIEAHRLSRQLEAQRAKRTSRDIGRHPNQQPSQQPSQQQVHQQGQQHAQQHAQHHPQQPQMQPDQVMQHPGQQFQEQQHIQQQQHFQMPASPGQALLGLGFEPLQQYPGPPNNKRIRGNRINPQQNR